MEGFGNILKAELFKLVKGKALVKLLIASIIIFIFITILFNFLYELAGDVLNMSATADAEVTEETVEIARLNYEEVVKNHGTLNASRKMMDTSVYQAKAVYNFYKYLYEHNISMSSVSMFGTISNLTTNSYITFVMSTMAMVFAIFGIVTIIRSLAGERVNGTLKMQLLRPVSKDAIIVGKFLATWIVTVGVMIFFFLATCVVGVLAFKFDQSQVYGIINAEKVFTMSPYGAMALTLFYYITYVSQFIILGLFTASFMRKNEGGAIALGIVILLIGSNIEEWLGYIFIGYVGIMQNMSWLNALTLSGPGLSYMNLYSMVGLSSAWFVGMFIGSICLFRNEDIHS